MRFYRKLWRLSVPVFVAAVTGLPLATNATGDVPPPGRLVSVGDHRLHIACVGTGGPTVLLDAGLGGSSLEWERVKPLLAKHLRTCAYDRAGYGWSEGGPLPRTSERIVFELNTLLRDGQIPGPYILVGHSFGGFNVRLYADYYGKHIAGLVLVDSAHEEQFTRLGVRGGLGNVPLGSNFFLTSLPGVPDNLPKAIKPLAQSLTEAYKAHRALRAELSAIRVSAQQVRKSSLDESIPVVVVTRGRRVWPDTDSGNRLERVWRELQIDLANQYPSARQIHAHQSGHYIHLDQPSLIVEAVLSITGAQTHP